MDMISQRNNGAFDNPFESSEVSDFFTVCLVVGFDQTQGRC